MNLKITANHTWNQNNSGEYKLTLFPSVNLVKTSESAELQLNWLMFQVGVNKPLDITTNTTATSTTTTGNN